jgi:hypothetical protein
MEKGRRKHRVTKHQASLNQHRTSYCYAHGTQGSHTSAQCKVMAGQPHNFTAEMRKATNPNQPPGGSTFVQGQIQ